MNTKKQTCAYAFLSALQDLRALKTSVQSALVLLDEDKQADLRVFKARAILHSALDKLGVQSEAELLSKQS